MTTIQKRERKFCFICGKYTHNVSFFQLNFNFQRNKKHIHWKSADMLKKTKTIPLIMCNDCDEGLTIETKLQKIIKI